MEKPLLYKYGCLRHGKAFYGEDPSLEHSLFQSMVETTNAMSDSWRRGIGARVRVA
jgi:hypothetical protein